jgi:hypothetical protein
MNQPILSRQNAIQPFELEQYFRSPFSIVSLISWQRDFNIPANDKKPVLERQNGIVAGQLIYINNKWIYSNDL